MVDPHKQRAEELLDQAKRRYNLYDQEIDPSKTNNQDIVSPKEDTKAGDTPPVEKVGDSKTSLDKIIPDVTAADGGGKGNW